MTITIRARCEKHPRYCGRGEPRHECETCLAIWARRQSVPRAGIRPARISSPSARIYRRREGKRVEE